MTIRKEEEEEDVVVVLATDVEQLDVVDKPPPHPFTVMEPVNTTIDTGTNGSGNNIDNDHNTMLTVLAPATLAAGYTFTAHVDGSDFLVTVLEGGVMEGQAFHVPYPDLNSSASPNTSSR